MADSRLTVTEERLEGVLVSSLRVEPAGQQDGGRYTCAADMLDGTTGQAEIFITVAEEEEEEEESVTEMWPQAGGTEKQRQHSTATAVTNHNSFDCIVLFSILPLLQKHIYS